MAPPSLKAWLRTFIRHEIDKALEWKRNLGSQDAGNPGDETSNEQPFEDDGSNFRSYVQRLEPGKDLVQLIEVTTVQDDFAEVCVSDGHVQVRARLPGRLVFQWERDAGEALALDTRNDVLKIQQLVVVSTSLGHPDGFVWLDILDMQYCYLLRKRLGDPLPIVQDKNTRLLIEEIAELRKDELANDTLAGSIPHQSTAASSDQRFTSRSPYVKVEPTSMKTPPLPQIQSTVVPSSRHATPSSPSIRSTRTLHEGPTGSSSARQTPSSIGKAAHDPAAKQQAQITEVSPPLHKSLARKSLPRLESDGFEVQQGVNLSAPTTAELLGGNVRGEVSEFPSSAHERSARLQHLFKAGKKRTHESATVLDVQHRQHENTETIAETPARLARTQLVGSSASSASPRTHVVSDSQTAVYHEQYRKDAPREASSPRQSPQLRRSQAASPEIADPQLHNEHEPMSPEIAAPLLHNEHEPMEDVVIHQGNDVEGPTTASNSAHDADSPNIAVSGSSTVEHTSPVPHAQSGAHTRNGDHAQDGHGSSSSKAEPESALNYQAISKDQQDLLDSAMSWYPSLPGRQLPLPNLPVKLLSQWQEQKEFWSKNHVVLDTSVSVPVAEESSSDQSDSSSSDSEEEFSASQWPASQTSPRRGDIPPDSSPPAAIPRGTQLSDLEISAPRALARKDSPRRPAPSLRPISPPRHPSDMHLERRRQFFNDQSKDTAAPPSRPRHERNAVASPERILSIFDEYYRNFRELCPGGHWARPERPASRPAIDVLSWRI